MPLGRAGDEVTGRARDLRRVSPSVARRRRLVAIGLVGGMAITVTWWATGRPSAPVRHLNAPATIRALASREPSAGAARDQAQGTTMYAERGVGRLPFALQDAAAASVAGRVVVLGGLDSSDVSTATVLSATPAGTVARLGRLPVALHDAAAVGLDGAVYLAGGGDGTAQHDLIIRIDPATGTATAAGRLPAAASDLGAAAIGGEAYFVGGYTGSRWLDTIVRWRPGSAARVVAHLPVAVRYAAVTAAGGDLVIAGGSTPHGATREVSVYDPATGRIRTADALPSPITHAAAAAAGTRVLVLGGRGDAAGSVTRRILSVDPGTLTTRPAGQLNLPRSDLTAVSVNGRTVLVGGRGPRGPVRTIATLVLRTPERVPATANVYAADGVGMLSPVVRGQPTRVYVPNSRSNTVDVIDPRTYRIVRHFRVGALPQHVVPSWDLRTLFVLNDRGNSVTPIDPRTGRPGRPLPVADPYNMYFTPDGRFAIVVAEQQARLDFRDPHTMRLRHALPVPCRGVDHIDFTADGATLLATCEFSGQLVAVDVRTRRVVRTIALPPGAMPQDVKLAPDGATFYVADMMRGGLYELDARTLAVNGFLPTGRGAHGLYPSRDARLLYVSNRSEGTVSVVNFGTRRVVRTWRIPGGGSPDMGGVSADGRTLWLTGRYDGEVYAIDTRTGRLRARIRVGGGPHGLSVWPQPGRYSLGHTGIMR